MPESSDAVDSGLRNLSIPFMMFSRTSHQFNFVRSQSTTPALIHTYLWLLHSALSFPGSNWQPSTPGSNATTPWLPLDAGDGSADPRWTHTRSWSLLMGGGVAGWQDGKVAGWQGARVTRWQAGLVNELACCCSPHSPHSSQ